MSTRNKIAVGIVIFFIITTMFLGSAMTSEGETEIQQNAMAVYMVVCLTLAACVYRGKSDQHKRIRKKNQAIKVGMAIMMIGVIISQTDVESLSIAMCVGLIFILYGVTGRKIKTDEDIERVRMENAEKDRIYRNTIKCKHSYGLPLSVGTECEIFKDDVNRVFKISGAGNTYTLAYDKVTDISITDTTDSQYVSSIGGAIAGGMLFGTLGAAIGGRAKQKKITEYFLVFTYNDKNSNVAYISMDIGSSGNATCSRWTKEFKTENKKEVEL